MKHRTITTLTARIAIVFLMLLATTATSPSPASASVTSARAAIGDEITHWYQTILGRTPDAYGLAYWTDYVASDCVNYFWQASRYFHDSDEAWDRGINNTQRITYLYQSILHRNPDASGLAYWVGQLNSGGRTAWRDVVGGISYSDEARRDIWGPMCRNHQMEVVEDINLVYSYNTWLIYAPTNAAGSGTGQTYWPSLRWDNDGCSNSPDGNYLESYRRHDFGYRNLKQTDTDFTFNPSTYILNDKLWDGYNKSDVDYQFRDDMTDACNLISGIGGSLCRAQIPVYFNAVRTGAEYDWRNQISSNLNNFYWRE